VAVQPSAELVVRGDTDGSMVAPDVTRFDRPDYTPHGPSPRAIARSRAPGEGATEPAVGGAAPHVKTGPSTRGASGAVARSTVRPVR